MDSAPPPGPLQRWRLALAFGLWVFSQMRALCEPRLAPAPHAALRGTAHGRAVTVAAAARGRGRDAGLRGGWGGGRRTHRVRTCAAAALSIPEKDENFCGADGTVRPARRRTRNGIPSPRARAWPAPSAQCGQWRVECGPSAGAMACVKLRGSAPWPWEDASMWQRGNVTWCRGPPHTDQGHHADIDIKRATCWGATRKTPTALLGDHPRRTKPRGLVTGGP